MDKITFSQYTITKYEPLKISQEEKQTFLDNIDNLESFSM